MMDDLDRILGNDPSLEPSSGLAERVMAAVVRERDTPPPIRFPWKRAIPGIALCSMALVTVTVLALSSIGKPGAPTPVDAQRLLEDPRATAVLWLLASMAFSWVVYRFSTRLSGTLH